MARTHDMDRKHMMEIFRRAYEHKGAAFVEVYQNCNVFNDGAFEAITAKDNRPSMLVPLEHGKPVRFGPDGEKGVLIDDNGSAVIVDVAEVGRGTPAGPRRVTAWTRAWPLPFPGWPTGPYSPTPIGVFRAVDRPDYGSLVQDQLVAAAARKGLVTWLPSCAQAPPGRSSKPLASGHRVSPWLGEV